MAWALVREWLPEGHETPPGTKRYPETLALQEIAAALADEEGDRAAARAWLEAHDRWVRWGGSVLGRPEGEEGWARYYGGRGKRSGQTHTPRGPSRTRQSRASRSHSSPPTACSGNWIPTRGVTTMRRDTWRHRLTLPTRAPRRTSVR